MLNFTCLAFCLKLSTRKTLKIWTTCNLIRTPPYLILLLKLPLSFLCQDLLWLVLLNLFFLLFHLLLYSFQPPYCEVHIEFLLWYHFDVGPIRPCLNPWLRIPTVPKPLSKRHFLQPCIIAYNLQNNNIVTVGGFQRIEPFYNLISSGRR